MRPAEHELMILPETIGQQMNMPQRCAMCGKAGDLKSVELTHTRLPGFHMQIPHCAKHYRIVRTVRLIESATLCFSGLGALIATVLWTHEQDRISKLAAMAILGIVFLLLALPGFVLSKTLTRLLLGKDDTPLDNDCGVVVAEPFEDGYRLRFQNAQFRRDFEAKNVDHVAPSHVAPSNFR